MTTEKDGSVIKQMRLRKKMSQFELAQAAGCHEVYISQLETGRRNPSSAMTATLARALGVSAKRLCEKPKGGERKANGTTPAEVLERNMRKMSDKAVRLLVEMSEELARR